MADTDDKARLEHLAGEVSALRAFAPAVIATHHEPHHLNEEFIRLSEHQIGLTTPADVSDAYVDGQRQTLDVLREYLRLRLER